MSPAEAKLNMYSAGRFVPGYSTETFLAESFRKKGWEKHSAAAFCRVATSHGRQQGLSGASATTATWPAVLDGEAGVPADFAAQGDGALAAKVPARRPADSYPRFDLGCMAGAGSSPR